VRFLVIAHAIRSRVRRCATRVASGGPSRGRNGGRERRHICWGGCLPTLPLPPKRGS
jgi:hypothetical protein